MQKLDDQKLDHKEKTTPWLCVMKGECQTLLEVLTRPASTQVWAQVNGLSTGGSTNQAIAWLSHNIGNESYILLSHCIFFSNTFILYIEIKTSTQTKSYVQTYPFKSIDGISSLDATFFSEEPENIKSPNLIKQLKKLQQWIQRKRTYRKWNMPDLQITLVCIELFCISETQCSIKIR